MQSQDQVRPVPSALTAVTFSLFACALMAMISVGCGRSGIERAVVSGKVTYRGQPIQRGQIRFVPTKGNQGPVSGADIVDGEYLVEAKGGVPVGSHAVRIEAYRQETRYPREAPPPGMRMDSLEVNTQYLPDRFNTRTQLEIQIDAGGGRLTKDFELND